MASALSVTLILLLFPLFIWACVFNRFPSFLEDLLRTPISSTSLASLALARRRPDPFDDTARARYSPPPLDQLRTRALLRRLLPLELVFDVLDRAEYWECISAVKTRGLIISNRSAPYLMSQRVPRRGRLEQIRISLRSRDQGWSDQPENHGTYRHSCTFFEGCLLRPTATSVDSDGSSSPSPSINTAPHRARNPFTWTSMEDESSAPPPVDIEVSESRCLVQYNIHAGKLYKNHTIVLPHPPVRDVQHSGLPELEELDPLLPDPRNALFERARPGDRVLIEAGARFPGWTNVVESGRVDLLIAWYKARREE